MRWRLVGRCLPVAAGFFEPVAEQQDLPLQCVDLTPLRGDGLVQGLDGVVLEHDARFQRVDPFVEFLTHRSPSSFAPSCACFGCSRKPWPSAMRSSNTKHSPRQRLSFSGTASRYL